MNLWSVTYDYPVAVSPSNTVDDPAGNFAGVLACGAGTLTVWPVAGPAASAGLSIPVVEGQYLHFPVKRIGTGGPTCLGLVSSIVRQGP